jgi:hypothetical protein
MRKILSIVAVVALGVGVIHLSTPTAEAQGMTKSTGVSGPLGTSFKLRWSSTGNDYISSDGSNLSTPVQFSCSYLNVGAGIQTQGGVTNLDLVSRATDAAGAVAHRLRNVNTLATDGAVIVAFRAGYSTADVATITKDGNIQLGIGNAATPACDAAHRGIIQYIGGGVGVKDKVEVCGKDAANAYAWRVLY